MLRILFVSTGSFDESQSASSLSAERVYRGLEAQLRKGERIICAELKHVRLDTLDRIESEVRSFRPNVLHFASPCGAAAPIPLSSLRQSLELLCIELRCLVLGAYDFGEQELLRLMPVPCVVALEPAAEAQIAAHFSTSFYAALAAGESLGNAFALAKNSAYGAAQPQSGLPLLAGLPGVETLPLVQRIKIFCIHAPAERDAYDELCRFLTIHRRAGTIGLSAAQDVPPTADAGPYSEEQLAAADVILCLGSPDFIADDRCDGLALGALRRYEEQRAAVIGILVRTCHWKETRLGALQPLPRSRGTLTRANRDAWWTEVSSEVMQVVRAQEETKLEAQWSKVGRGLAASIISPTVPVSAPPPPQSREAPTALRAQLQELFPAASDFEAFCLDYFRHVYRQFASGQDRTQRENLLFERVPPDEILASLSGYRNRVKLKR